MFHPHTSGVPPPHVWSSTFSTPGRRFFDIASQLTDEVEKGLAGRSAGAAAERMGQELRHPRDRVVLQLLEVTRGIRRSREHAYRNDYLRRPPHTATTWLAPFRIPHSQLTGFC